MSCFEPSGWRKASFWFLFDTVRPIFVRLPSWCTFSAVAFLRSWIGLEHLIALAAVSADTRAVRFHRDWRHVGT